MDLFHYTDKHGFNAIGSQVVWLFRRKQRRPDIPSGAFFTSLSRDAPAFSARTRIPKEKQACAFQFRDAGDLKPLDGGRGAYIFYSREDYAVGPDRQISPAPKGVSPAPNGDGGKEPEP